MEWSGPVMPAVVSPAVCQVYIGVLHEIQGITASKWCETVLKSYPKTKQYSTSTHSESYSMNPSSLSSMHTDERWS